MKRVILCNSVPMYLGKFVILLSDNLITGLDDKYYCDKLPGYIVCTLVSYDPKLNSIEGNILNHIELENLLDTNHADVICGSVDIASDGNREITFNDSKPISNNILSVISDIYNLD